MNSLEERVISEFNDGMSISKIGNICKISVDRILKILVSAGICDATPKAEIVNGRYAEGASVGTIAKELKVTRGAVTKYLPYISSPRKPWTAEENKMVLKGIVPDGRTPNACRQQKHRLLAAKSKTKKWKDSPLRRQRLRIRLTQVELSRVSDVPLSTIRAYEQGTRNINEASISVLNRLAAALQCSYRDIILEEEK